MRPYGVFLIISGVTAFGSACAFTLNLVYQQQSAGFGPLELVLIGTALEVVYFLAQIPTGLIADLYSRRLSVIVGVLLTGAGILVQALSPTFLAILFGTALWGIGAACIDGALEAWAADELGEDRVGAALNRGAQVGQVGTILGVGAAAALGPWHLWLPVALGGAIWFGLGIFLPLVMPERNFHRLPQAERPGSLRAMRKQVVDGSRAARGRPVLLLLGGATLFVALGSEGLDRLGVAHLLEHPARFGSVVGWIGVLSVAGTLGSIGLSQVIRRYSDAMHPVRVGRMLVGLQAVLVLLMGTFALVGSFWPAAACWLVISMVRSSAAPLWSTWIIAQTESATRATVFSAISMVDAAGQIVGGPPVGIIGQRLSIGRALLASALLTAPAMAFLSAALRRQRDGSMGVRRTLAPPVPRRRGAPVGGSGQPDK
jgi:MFS transporter, DHA3 family, tetracycline resistance protein